MGEVRVKDRGVLFKDLLSELEELFRGDREFGFDALVEGDMGFAEDSIEEIHSDIGIAFTGLIIEDIEEFRDDMTEAFDSLTASVGHLISSAGAYTAHFFYYNIREKGQGLSFQEKGKGISWREGWRAPA